LAAWREAGADRYLLRFETSNRTLYDRIHPPRPGMPSDRIALLKSLRALGYEIGSGVMIGIPGQTYEDLARDIETFASLDLDMIGVGPYLPHPDTPLGSTVGISSPLGSAVVNVSAPLGLAAAGAAAQLLPTAAGEDQVPNGELMTYKVVALARLACPRANIPATTALATLNAASGRELGLTRGANVVMPNLTPPKYRALYEIYPNKACVSETADACNSCLQSRIESLRRRIGNGRGDSPNYLTKKNNSDATSAVNTDAIDNFDRLAADGTSVSSVDAPLNRRQLNVSFHALRGTTS
jgi:biotin synthase